MGPMDEKNWQAESDMHALMRAEEIKRDKNRMMAAQDHAKKVARMAGKVAHKMGDSDDADAAAKGYRKLG